MEHKVYYLSEQDVVNALNMPKAITALTEMLRLHGKNQVMNVPKALGRWADGSTMHALGSVMTEESGYAGFKTWTNTKRGGGSLFTLFDAHTGLLLAIIEARALGMMRTAAGTGVATQLLAPESAKVAALIGTGPQAVTQLEALLAVRDFERIQVYSPTAENREAFVAKVSQKHDVNIVASQSLGEALSGAEVLTTVTRATDPFITADMLADCRHVNALGAILPSKAEFDTSCLQLADQIVVDDRENARKGSKELNDFLAGNEEGWDELPTLGTMLVEARGRDAATKLSFYKGMGMGLSDLAMAKFVYEHAVENDSGIHLPPQTRKNLLLS